MAQWLRHLAPKREFMGSTLHWVPNIEGWPGRYIIVRRCVALSIVLLQLKDPLELFVKRRGFLSGSGFLSRRDMTLAVERDIKPQTFLPSFVQL